MGILADALSAYAGVASGQLSPGQAVSGLGLQGQSASEMMAIYELVERSQRSSGELAARLNTAEARERQTVIDAQVRYHNDLLDHNQALADINAANWRASRQRLSEMRRAVLQRKAEMSDARSNAHNGAMTRLRESGTSTAGQWANLVGYLSIHGESLSDIQLFATISQWSQDTGNPDFMDMEALRHGDTAAIKQHLQDQQIPPSQWPAILAATGRAHTSYSAVVEVENEAAAAEEALNAFNDPAINDAGVSAALQTARSSIDNLLGMSDPTTMMTGTEAITAQGSYQRSFDLLAEQAALRDRLLSDDATGGMRLRNAVGSMISDPEFQQWARDNGFNVGFPAPDGQYIPGRQDEVAILAWRRELNRGMHRYGPVGGSTGHFIEIPDPAGGTVGGTYYRIPGLESRQGELTIDEIKELGLTVEENDDGTINLSHPRLDMSQAQNLAPSSTSRPRTIEVERARVNAARMHTNPGMVEVFMPPDGRIVVISQDDIIQTVRDGSRDPRMPRSEYNRTAMSRRNRLFSRLINEGIVDPETGEVHEYGEYSNEKPYPRWVQRAIAQREGLSDADLDRMQKDMFSPDLEGVPEGVPEDPYNEEEERARLQALPLPDDVIDRIFESDIDPRTIQKPASPRSDVPDSMPIGPAPERPSGGLGGQPQSLAVDQVHTSPLYDGDPPMPIKGPPYRQVRRGHSTEAGDWVPGQREADGNYWYQILKKGEPRGPLIGPDANEELINKLSYGMSRVETSVTPEPIPGVDASVLDELDPGQTTTARIEEHIATQEGAPGAVARERLFREGIVQQTYNGDYILPDGRVIARDDDNWTEIHKALEDDSAWSGPAPSSAQLPEPPPVVVPEPEPTPEPVVVPEPESESVPESVSEPAPPPVVVPEQVMPPSDIDMGLSEGASMAGGPPPPREQEGDVQPGDPPEDLEDVDISEIDTSLDDPSDPRTKRLLGQIFNRNSDPLFARLRKNRPQSE